MMLKPLTQHFAAASTRRLAGLTLSRTSVLTARIKPQEVARPWLMASVSVRDFTPPTGSKRAIKKKKDGADKEANTSTKLNEDANASAEADAHYFAESGKGIKPKKTRATNVRYRHSYNYHRLILDTREAVSLLTTLELGALQEALAIFRHNLFAE